MKDLQKFVDNFGFGITAKDLASKAYWHMKDLGYDVCIVNERYLEINGTTYFFSKSRKIGGWIVKEI